MSASGSQALVSALEVVGVLALSGVGTWWVIRRERKNPTSYTRRAGALADWQAKSVSEQTEADDAALDTGERAEQGWVRRRWEWRQWQPDTVADASEAAGELAVELAARNNVLNHP
jgi:hypothetical protein